MKCRDADTFMVRYWIEREEINVFIWTLRFEGQKARLSGLLVQDVSLVRQVRAPSVGILVQVWVDKARTRGTGLESAAGSMSALRAGCFHISTLGTTHATKHVFFTWLFCLQSLFFSLIQMFGGNVQKQKKLLKFLNIYLNEINFKWFRNYEVLTAGGSMRHCKNWTLSRLY